MIDHFDDVPGWPAQQTRVYAAPGERIPLGKEATGRAERNAKWKAANRAEYLAGKRAWYHRWKAKNCRRKTSQLGSAA